MYPPWMHRTVEQSAAMTPPISPDTTSAERTNNRSIHRSERALLQRKGPRNLMDGTWSRAYIPERRTKVRESFMEAAAMVVL